MKLSALIEQRNAARKQVAEEAHNCARAIEQLRDMERQVARHGTTGHASVTLDGLLVAADLQKLIIALVGYEAINEAVYQMVITEAQEEA